MQQSTVKRESLIPRLHLLSIALLLVVAFVILLPSRETFTYSSTQNTKNSSIDDLDLAYIKARDASGKMSEGEMQLVIHDMIRTKKWRQARTLMAQRPDLRLEPKDQYLLDLQTASAGFYSAKNEAGSASHRARLIDLMHVLYDNTDLHDEDTLTTAAEFSADLEQAALSARYYTLLADNYPANNAKYYEQCARVLQRVHMYGESVDCYNSAIAYAPDPIYKSKMYIRLTKLHLEHGETLAAKSTIETLALSVPNDKTSLELTASLALENSRPDLAYPLYASLADIDSDRAVFWFEKAAKWSEASNLPGLSAEYVLSIRDLSDKKYYAALTKRRQSLLIAAGRNEEALNTMYERIAANPDSGDELVEGINLASSMGLTQQASEWNEELLRIRPFDIEAMVRQVNYSLGNQRLEEGLVWSKKILEQEPLDPVHRLRLARLEEWNGNVDAAMKQRQWLSENNPSVANDTELLRIAELNWDSLIAASALHRISKTRQLSTEEIYKLVELYEQDGSPQLAASALEGMLGGDNDAMILRKLAELHTYHSDYNEALAAWESFSDRFGRSAEESLNRMELLWRLKRPQEALLAAAYIDQFNSSAASQYQLALLTELGWRNRKPELVVAAAPYLDQLEGSGFGQANNRRLVQSHIDANNYSLAITTAENLWRETDEISFLLTAMNLALQEKIYPHYERYLDANGDLLKVRELPEYWLAIADHHNRNSDTQAALETYRSTLAQHPENESAMNGLIWAMLGENTDNATLLATLEEHESTATKAPRLWHPYAVAYLRAKEPQTSLRWFSKIMAKGDHDYNILLSFADALEQTGNSTHAYRVRHYTLGELLPRAMASATGDIDDIGREYISLLRSFGSTAENEAWTQKLLAGVEDASPEESAWRRELAASWYLSTQRSDYARLVMTKIHERRLESPAWQRLALALTDNNLPEIREILASSKDSLTSGDEILALRTLGYERQAFVTAQNTVENSKSFTDRNVAKEHLLSMRSSRPGFYSGQLTQRALGDLDITESSLSLRHTLSAEDLGFEVDYKRNILSSDQVALASDIEDNIEVSAYFGNTSRGGRLTAGVNSYDSDELNYTSGAYHIRDLQGKRELTSEIAINEIPESSNTNLRLNAKQDTAQLAFRSTLGKREFVAVSGNFSDVTSRDTDESLLRTFGGSVELGTTGSIGSNNWTMGVIASGAKNTSGSLPQGTSQQLSLSASLFRGGIRADYPTTASPRYQLSAQVGHNWVAESTDLQLLAGAGFRLLGNDELSFQIEHLGGIDSLLDERSDSKVGVQYTNHF